MLEAPSNGQHCPQLTLMLPELGRAGWLHGGRVMLVAIGIRPRGDSHLHQENTCCQDLLSHIPCWAEQHMLWFPCKA